MLEGPEQFQQVKFLELLERLTVATEALVLEGLEERVQAGDDDYYEEWRRAVAEVAVRHKQS